MHAAPIEVLGGKPKRRLGSLQKRTHVYWCLFCLHLDAFLLNPKAYVTALKWRIIGKRLRARAHFATLLSESSRAYELWTLFESETLSSDPAMTGRIKALVRNTDDQPALELTLQNLAASGIAASIVGRCQDGTLRLLADQLAGREAPWLMPLRAWDRISRCAAATYLSKIAEATSSCTVIYADDDIYDLSGRRAQPYMKPSFNSELQCHHDMLTGACIVRVDAATLSQVADFDDWDAQLVAAAVRQGSVTHVPNVLHHRRSRPEAPTRIEPLKPAERLPSVSVIIPTRNRADLLRTCITGLRATRYPDVEIIVANNDSNDPETLAYLEQIAGEGVRVIDHPGPFNYSAINNRAVAAARGDLICLMNNDIEILASDWLAIMATQALRPEVGAVGAQLLYPDGRIQHAGVVIGMGNAAGHAHRFTRPEAEGYFRRHALPQFVSAVTGACLVVRKDRFLAVGGLDEDNFAVAFNDVDLCLKLNQRGWQSFYEPRAVLVHHESISRGDDKDPIGAARFAGELKALQRIWRTDQIVDPYHHPMLSRASEQFALDLMAKALPLL